MPADSVSCVSIGALGAGFSEDALDRGIERGVDFIGADAGSVDGGPFALAGKGTNFPNANCQRDLDLLVRGAVKGGVPLLQSLEIVRATVKQPAKLEMLRPFAQWPA